MKYTGIFFSMLSLGFIKESLLHLAFPHICEGCGTDRLPHGNYLCLSCISRLPATGYHLHRSNPVEKIFWGRLPLRQATAQYYFSKGGIMQQLLHALKYKGHRELGLYLGRLMGGALAQSSRFASVEALVPLPLYPERERARGYNQADLLCEGISGVLQRPVWRAVRRVSPTETQTKKSRVERWQNMEGRFEVEQAAALRGKHLLLVDDVVTTGATLESCGAALLQVEGVQLSIATLCFSARI